MLVVLLFAAAAAKSLRQTVDLSATQPAAYLTKFGVDLGTGTWDMRIRIVKGPKDYNSNSTIPLKLFLYRDKEFDLGAFECQSRGQPIKHVVNTPASGKWSPVYRGPIGEPDQPFMWFFVLGDCERRLTADTRIRVELNIYSGDDSHLSVEFKGLKRIYIVVCVVLCALWANNLRKLIHFFSSNERVETNIVVLNTAIGLEFLALLFHCVHLAWYESNGRGLAVFEVLGDATGLASEFTMMLLLLVIAQGWTLKFREFPQPEVYVPILLLLSLFQLVVSAVEHWSVDSYYQFSNYEGFTGLCVTLERLALLGLLLRSACQLFHDLSPKLVPVAQQFIVLAVSYVLTVPLLILASKFLPPYKRHKVILGGALLVHGVTMAGLSYLFTTKSGYYKASTMSAGILPFGKSHKH